jgi:hypothetical protein
LVVDAVSVAGLRGMSLVVHALAASAVAAVSLVVNAPFVPEKMGMTLVVDPLAVPWVDICPDVSPTVRTWASTRAVGTADARVCGSQLVHVISPACHI